MDVRCELAPAVAVAEEVAYDCEDGAEGLDRDVPAGADDLVNGLSTFRVGERSGLGAYTEDHAGGEDDTPGKNLDGYVDP